MKIALTDLSWRRADSGIKYTLSFERNKHHTLRYFSYTQKQYDTIALFFLRHSKRFLIRC